MLRHLLLCGALAAAGSPIVIQAHHSYAAYLQERKTPVAGTLERYTVANPHSTLVVRTSDGTAVTVEWRGLLQLQRSGFRPEMLAVGDRIVITGSPARDPQDHRLSLITEIRRPADGWRWQPGGITLAATGAGR